MSFLACRKKVAFSLYIEGQCSGKKPYKTEIEATRGQYLVSEETTSCDARSSGFVGIIPALARSGNLQASVFGSLYKVSPARSFEDINLNGNYRPFALNAVA